MDKNQYHLIVRFSYPLPCPQDKGEIERVGTALSFAANPARQRTPLNLHLFLQNKGRNTKSLIPSGQGEKYIWPYSFGIKGKNKILSGSYENTENKLVEFVVILERKN